MLNVLKYSMGTMLRHFQKKKIIYATELAWRPGRRGTRPAQLHLIVGRVEPPGLIDMIVVSSPDRPPGLRSANRSDPETGSEPVCFFRNRFDDRFNFWPLHVCPFHGEAHHTILKFLPELYILQPVL
jgi:hypothetical protein